MYNEEQIISKWMADMYDQFTLDTSDTAFALSLIGKEPRNTLEIACGSGRILVPLAQAGHNVTGLDFDECMLERISEKAAGLKNIAWHKSDVISDTWGKGYDVVLLAGNFLFNIVSDMEYHQAQALLIQKSADALVSGGHLFIDYGYTLHPEKWFINPNENVIWKGTDRDGTYGKMSLLGSTFDAQSGMNYFTRRFEMTLSDGTSFTKDIPSKKHFVTLEQIHDWLKMAGLEIEEEYGDYNKNPISETTSRAILWARKN